MEVLFLIGGAAVGFVIAYLWLNGKSGKELAAIQEKSRLLEETLSRNKQEYATGLSQIELRLDTERQKSESLNALASSLKTEKENLESKLNEQKKDLELLQEKFTKEFENLANKILDEKSQKFTEQNKYNIDIILNPLKEKIRDFESKIHQTHLDQEKERSALKEQLRTFTEMNKKMSQEAINLTNALKGEVKTQGNWGELILEKILEKSGLRKGAEYDLQQSFTGEDGNRLQPDAVIHLPEGKNLIVDSKVSLTAYEKYYSSDNPEEQTRYLKEHILSFRNHIKGLSSKNYQNLYNIGSPDFVLLFVPIEPAFSLAVGNDDTLYSEAFEKNVIIVSTSTLLATLRTIENIWKQERQNKNVLEIAKQSGDLYDKFASVVEDFIKLGAKMNEGKNVYDEAMKKLYTGRGNVVSRFESLKTLGAKVSKSINPKILDRTEDLEEE